MTKQEFIDKVRACKCCRSKRAIRCNFSLNDNLEVVASIECQNCHSNEHGTNPVHVLANWNVKNYDKRKTYLVTIQAKDNPRILKQIRFDVESISEITLEIESKLPSFEILSIKEIVS